MRVIAGKARSIKLESIKDVETRPTLDIEKETLFNIINFDLVDSIFVDLFSGFGGIGIEALSRGAKKTYFIDNNKQCINIINKNLEKTHLKENAVVLQSDYLVGLNFVSEDIDIVFIDPPYNNNLEQSIFNALKNNSHINKDTLIILEAKKELDLSFLYANGFEIIREKIYKTNKHVFLKEL